MNNGLSSFPDKIDSRDENVMIGRRKFWIVLLTTLVLSSGGPRIAEAQTMCFGVGDRFLWQLQGTEYKTTPQLLSWLDFPESNRLLGIWLPTRWEASWFKGIDKAMKHGYVPVFFDYPLGDFNQGRDSWSYLQSHQKEFFASVWRLRSALQSLHGRVLIVLQPEFNIPGIQEHPAFGRMLAKAADILHQATHPGLQILVGTCVGDFGNYEGVTDDRREWSLFAPALRPAIAHLDFLAFQEMRGGTHRNAEGEMKSYTPKQEGIELLGKRTTAFSAYLQAQYHLPLLLAYVEVATLTPPGLPPETWESAATLGYQEILQQVPQLRQNGVFGVMAMSLFDNKAANNQNQSFWGNAEDHFGLVESKSPIGQSLIGYPPYLIKPSGKVWIKQTSLVSKDACEKELDTLFSQK